MISRNVCAYGAFSFSFAASCARLSLTPGLPATPARTCAKRRTCTVAPAPYHHGPLTPYLYATAELWRSVAAHVHALTTALAIRPGRTLRLALLNSSALSVTPL
jgi:hypothetical protein